MTIAAAQPPLILFYNRAFAGFGDPTKVDCGGSCELTADPGRLAEAKAIVFHIPTLRGIPLPPKHPLQPWVAWSMESAVNYPELVDPTFMRQFEITMTYRRLFLAEPSPSHARGPALLSCAGNRPHIPLMAGSPLKRQRKAGIRADDGSVIAFPYMPRVADLPRGWRHWSPAQKIEHLLGMTLDDIAEIMSWGPIAELDPFRLSVRMQVTRIVFMIGMKAWLNGTLGREAARERDPVLEKLSLELRTQLRERTAPET
jgi:hypothetical protein